MNLDNIKTRLDIELADDYKNSNADFIYFTNFNNGMLSQFDYSEGSRTVAYLSYHSTYVNVWINGGFNKITITKELIEQYTTSSELKFQILTTLDSDSITIIELHLILKQYFCTEF